MKRKIVAYFQKQKDVDKKRIVLIGESQGGLVSALAASELKKQVSNLVLIFPAFCIPDNWNERYPRVEDIPEVSEITPLNNNLGDKTQKECVCRLLLIPVCVCFSHTVRRRLSKPVSYLEVFDGYFFR